MPDTFTERASSPEGRRGLACAAARYRAVELIGEILDESGMTQRELARRLGRTESAVSQILGGDRNLTLNTLTEYLDALDHRLDMYAVPCVEGQIRVEFGPLDVPPVVSYGTPDEHRVGRSYRLAARA